MNTATPFPSSDSPAGASPGTTFRAAFEHAPIAVARCNPQGVIVDMNSAFERTLDRGIASRRRLRLCELVRPQDRDKTDLLLRDLLNSQRDSIDIEAPGAGRGQTSAKWTAWRQPGCAREPDHALLMVLQNSVLQNSVLQNSVLQNSVLQNSVLQTTVQRSSDTVPAEEIPLQTQRWEAVGRLTGGVVHDFNNLLTGVMLYCDLLLSSLDARDRRRQYADEIRSAIVQASGLVRQLLVFARPQAAPAQHLCLNEIAGSMRSLLTRLIGENIALDLHLDPHLGAVKIDQAQAQQIILNLVLNARTPSPTAAGLLSKPATASYNPLPVRWLAVPPRFLAFFLWWPTTVTA
jgi:signal transduction histidine kinase